MTTRVIVKNIPSYINEKRLREHFGKCGEVTDCKIMTLKVENENNDLFDDNKKQGKSRGFCFIGFKLSTEAQKCIKSMRNTYLDTNRIAVEMARPIGDNSTRAWSKYSMGSSAHKRENPDAYKEEEEAKRLAKKLKRDEKALEGQKWKKEKEENKLQLDEFLNLGKKKKKEQVMDEGENKKGALGAIASLGEEDTEKKEDESHKDENKKKAFDSGLSDLAYLMGKKDETLETKADDEGPKKKKQKKNKKGEEPEATTSTETPVEIPPAPIIEGQAEVEASGRLYVTNLPYVATEDEVKEFFNQWGPISCVKICNSEDTFKSRGFCYVTYVFPEHALKVLSMVDLPDFQGRLLRSQAAKELPQKEKTEEDEWNEWYQGGSSYKKKKEKQKKEVDAHREQTWNLLYMSSVTANQAMASKLGIDKRELMNKDEGNLAVTQALAETHIIQETKQWLEREGIHIDAFTRKGSNLTTSALPAEKVRRDDTIIVKHLPPEASPDKLREKFGRFGELLRCALAPSKTVAVIQYHSASSAKIAFQKSAFSRFLHVPLYLEWAPEEIFSGTPTPSNSSTAPVTTTETKDTTATVTEEDADAEVVVATIFVKNLSFKTTQERLEREFRAFKGFRKATIMMKKKALASGKTEELSMGYGFLEFQTSEQVKEVIKKKQKSTIDGHAIHLQVSSSGSGQKREVRGGAQERTAKDGKVPTSNKLCVRNLAFEANKKELRALFGTFGTISSLRIPKKPTGGHRGFAFIDFLTKQEALNAYENLQHTHFYGRHLVIEPAEKDAETVEELREKQKLMEAKKGTLSESKKRRRTAELDGGGAGFSSAAGV